MNRKLFSSILLSFCCLSLITVGFASWSYGEKAFGNINGDAQFGEFISADSILLVGKPKVFSVCQEGIDDNGKIVTSCGLDFNLRIQNAYIGQNVNSVDFKTTIEFSNLSSTLEGILTAININDVAFAGTKIFSPITSRSQTLDATINVPIVAGQFTDFKLSYIFSANFYNSLLGDMDFNLSIAKVGTK